jgi:hypothetical protein
VDITKGQRVRVHFNLHRGDWVIGDPSTGKVITYVDDVVLTGVRFVVSAAGLARSKRLGKRTVHAHAVGTLDAWNTRTRPDGGTHVTYNPKRCGSFTTGDGTPVSRATRAHFHDAHVTAAGAA